MSSYWQELNTNPIKLLIHVIVMNKDHEILVSDHSWFDEGLIAIPNGKVNIGESYVQAAKRILYDETGLNANYFQPVHHTGPLHQTKHYQYISLFFCAEVNNLHELDLDIDCYWKHWDSLGYFCDNSIPLFELTRAFPHITPSHLLVSQ